MKELYMKWRGMHLIWAFLSYFSGNQGKKHFILIPMLFLNFIQVLIFILIKMASILFSIRNSYNGFKNGYNIKANESFITDDREYDSLFKQTL